MTPNELVGKRIRQAREQLPQLVPGRRSGWLDQTTVGLLLEKYLGKPWTKQAVSAAETGRRVLDVTELLAFASVLGKPMWFFFAPEVGEHIDMPTGAALNPHVHDYVEVGAPHRKGEGGDIKGDAIRLARAGLEEALKELQ